MFLNYNDCKLKEEEKKNKMNQNIEKKVGNNKKMLFKRSTTFVN